MIEKDAIEILKSIQDSLEETKFLERCAIDMAIQAIKRPKVTYICKDKGNDYCHHTSHVSMARNFEKVGDNAYQEILELTELTQEDNDNG